MLQLPLFIFNTAKKLKLLPANASVCRLTAGGPPRGSRALFRFTGFKIKVTRKLSWTHRRWTL